VRPRKLLTSVLSHVASSFPAGYQNDLLY
jgi:hypothetical protein